MYFINQQILDFTSWKSSMYIMTQEQGLFGSAGENVAAFKFSMKILKMMHFINIDIWTITQKQPNKNKKEKNLMVP